MPRNAELERLAEIFLGDRTLSVTNQWWSDDATTVTSGTATCQWLGDSSIRLQADVGGVPTWDFVLGRNDARDGFVALHHDERGVLGVVDVTLDDGAWAMSRTDPR